MDTNIEKEIRGHKKDFMPLVEQCISEKRAMKCVHEWWLYYILIPLSNGNWLVVERMHDEDWDSEKEELTEWYGYEEEQVGQDELISYININIYPKEKWGYYEFCASRIIPLDKLPDNEQASKLSEWELFNLDEDEKSFWEQDE